MSLVDYEVPDNHAERMMTMIGLDTSGDGEQPAVLPDVLREKYIEMRVTADRIGMGISDIHLWCIVHSVKVDLPQMAEPTVPELFKSEKIKIGQPVLCTLGRKTDIPGLLIGVDNDDRAIVQIEGGDERRFVAEKVRLAQGSAG